MKRIRRIILGFVGLACTGFAAAIGASSLMEKGGRAEVMTVLFTSFGAGAVLANLIRDIRSKK